MDFTFTGVFNRQTIVEQSKAQLVIREQPLAEWLFAAVILLAAANAAIFQFRVTAGAGVIIAAAVVLRARTRYITFDMPSETLTIAFQTPLKRETVNTIELPKVKRAYLKKENSGHTQIILVDVFGQEMGLSVYSRDMMPWKEDVILAVNAFLHEFQQQQEDDEEPAGAVS
jgi:hypothetical protein